MMSEPEKQTIAKHILPNISRNKGSQTKKIGQLLKNHTQNAVDPRPFSEKSKLSISLD